MHPSLLHSSTVRGPSPSTPAHVGPVKALRRIALGRTIMAAHVPARLLRSRDLGLELSSIGVDPLQLAEMAVEDAHDLAQLFDR